MPTITWTTRQIWRTSNCCRVDRTLCVISLCTHKEALRDFRHYAVYPLLSQTDTGHMSASHYFRDDGRVNKVCKKVMKHLKAAQQEQRHVLFCVCMFVYRAHFFWFLERKMALNANLNVSLYARGNVFLKVNVNIATQWPHCTVWRNCSQNSISSGQAVKTDSEIVLSKWHK